MEVSKILETITEIYHDSDYDRIPLERYLSYITDALNLILLVRPDAGATNADVTLVAGNEQSLPDDGYRLIDVMFNIDSGNNPTQPITKVDRMIMDNSYQTWMNDSDTEVLNYIYDVAVPKKFWVYPKVPAGSKIRLVYSQAFAEITSATDTVDIEDIFFAPIIDAVMFFLYRIDSESSEFALQKAEFHANTFNSALGIEQKMGLDIAPAGGK